MRTSVNEISCCCCCLSVFPVLLTMSSTVMHVLGPGMSSRTLKAGVGVPSFKFFVYICKQSQTQNSEIEILVFKTHLFWRASVFRPHLDIEPRLYNCQSSNNVGSSSLP